jgi:RNA polymerase sigma-70 factor (ECF subfamily)
MTSNQEAAAAGETPYDPDLHLVHAAREGNRSAFEELVKRYDRQLFRIAQTIVRQREDAEDVVQEALFKAFKKLQQFQGKSKFSTWLIRITVNQALMKVRKDGEKWISIEQNSRLDVDGFPREIVDWAPDPEMLYRNAELRRILEESLQKLEPGLRAVFLLQDVEGLSIQEVAQALTLTQSAVKTRARRARLQLRDRLSRYFRKDIQLLHSLPAPSPVPVPSSGVSRLSSSDRPQHPLPKSRQAFLDEPHDQKAL